MRTLPSVPFLKPTGADRPGGELAVHLRLGGARADRAPGHQVADVLRRDHVEELAARGHADPVDAHQQVARDAQSLVDAEAAVQVGIVDEALPAHRGARLLEIHAHDHFQLLFMLFPFCRSFPHTPPRRGSWIEHGPMITSRRSDLPRTISRTRCACPETSFSTGVPWIGKKRIRCSGRRQRDDVLDALVVGEGSLVVDGHGDPKKKTARLSLWRFVGFAGDAASRSPPPEGVRTRRIEK
jgi:hypothetical protein